MKKLLRVFLVLTCILILDLSANPVNAEAKTYYIKSVSDLRAVMKHPNGTFYLTKNLDLNGKEWTPIGTDEKPFSGSFYGQGHTIKNLKVTKTRFDAGLFGVTSGAKISKLCVTGNVKNVECYGGGIVGHARENTKISYCMSKVYVSGEDQIGGIVGRVSDSTVKYCINYNKVKATGRCAGGITADLYPSGYLTKCLNLAPVVGGNDLTGGITGGSTAGVIEGCVNTGNVSRVSGAIGAIAGDNTIYYAGARYDNYFLRTSTVNRKLKAIGENCHTISSKSSKKVTNILKTVKSYF